MSNAMNRLLSALATLGVATLWTSGPAAHAESPAPSIAQPTTLPSTMPSTPDAKALIKQLGADDFKQRDAATEQLRKMGKDALPALKEATTSGDPEVQARAQSLIHDLEHKDDKPAEADAQQQNGIGEVRINGQRFQIQQGGAVIMPGANGGMIVVHGGVNVGGPHIIGPNGVNPNGAGPGMVRRPGMNGGIVFGGGNGAITIQVTSKMNVNGVETSDQTITTNGNTYKLHTDKDGLKMTVTENGQTKEYTAKTADDLKKADPEAFKTYERVFSKPAAGANVIEIKPVPPPETGEVAPSPAPAPEATKK